MTPEQQLIHLQVDRDIVRTKEKRIVSEENEMLLYAALVGLYSNYPDNRKEAAKYALQIEEIINNCPMKD